MQLEPTSEASSPLGTEASANGKFEEVGDKMRGGVGGGAEEGKGSCVICLLSSLENY